MALQPYETVRQVKWKIYGMSHFRFICESKSSIHVRAKKMAGLKLAGIKRNQKRGRANIASIDRRVGHPFDLREAPTGKSIGSGDTQGCTLYIFYER